MNRKLFLLIPLASLIIACMTCNSTTTPPSGSSATDEAPDNSVSAAGIVLYNDNDGEAGSTELDVFPTTQRILHFETKVDPVNTGQKVRWVFTALEAGDLSNEEISEIKLDIPQDNVTTLSASLSNDSDWPSGTYKVEIYLDGDLLKSGEFQIAGE